MKQGIKRIIKYLMAFALLFTFVPIEIKANSSDNIDLYIDNESVNLNSSNQYLLNDYSRSNVETEDYRAFFDVENKKLYLKNYDNGSIVLDLGYKTTIEIILIGDNKIDTGNKGYGIWGSMSGDNIIINSNDKGSLTINLTNTASNRALPAGILSYALINEPLGSVKIMGNASVNINVKNEHSSSAIRPHGITTKEFEITDNANLDINVETVDGGHAIGIGYYHPSYYTYSRDILINTNGNVRISTMNTRPDDSHPILTRGQIKIDKVNEAIFISNNVAEKMLKYEEGGLLISDSLVETISEDSGETTIMYKSQKPLKAKYNVKFIDHDGTELKSEIVDEGSDATPPADPTRDGYSFTGWDKNYKNIESNLVVKAVYQIEEITPLYTYEIISGANQTWEKGSSQDLIIKVDAPMEKFSGLKYLGGSSIDEKYYQVEAGSTIITIFAEYLEILDAGQKVLHILYSDHDPIQTNLTIKAKASESDDEQITPEQPKEEDPKEEEEPKDAEKPAESEKDKLPGMGDNYFLSYLALLLMALGSILTIKSKAPEE